MSRSSRRYPLTLGGRPTNSDLLRKSAAYHTAGLAALFLLMVADDLVSIWKGEALPWWELLELAAALGVCAVTMSITGRLSRHIKRLEGLLCICMECKRVRQGEAWVDIDRYVAARSSAQFSHGLCADCYARAYGEPAD